MQIFINKDMANPDHLLLVTTRTIPSTPFLVVVAVFFVFRFGLVLFSVVCRFVCFHVKLFVEGVFTFFRFATFTTEGVQLPSATLDIRKYTIKHFICVFFCPVYWRDGKAITISSSKVVSKQSHILSFQESFKEIMISGSCLETSTFPIARENSRHFEAPPLVSPRNHVCTEIPYW